MNGLFFIGIGIGFSLIASGIGIIVATLMLAFP